MSRNGTLVLLTLSLASVSLVPMTAEAVDVYTDRGTWEAALTTVRMVEDFESETPGIYMTPYQTAGGISVERLGIFMDLTVRDNGAVNNSREMLVQDYGGRSLWAFPSNRHQLGFGFDWATGGEDWTLKFLGQEYTLDANSSGFIGLVDVAGENYGFELTSPEETQDGLAIDNLTYSPVLLVFTERAAWETAIDRVPVTENFETDSPGAYQTPYTTGGNCELQSLGSVITLNVFDTGLVDGSNELHFRDYGNQLSFSFPGGMTQLGFGFDWEAPVESWDLIVRTEHISLIGLQSGFIGVVDQTRLIDSFVLSSLNIVQQGMHMDNLSYSDSTVPTVRVTWGAIKSKYE